MTRALEANFELKLIGADDALVFVAPVDLGDAVILELAARGERRAFEHIELAVEQVRGERKAPVVADWAAQDRLQAALLACAGVDGGGDDGAVWALLDERREHVVGDAIVESETEALACALVGEVDLVGVGHCRLEIGIAGVGAVGVEEAQRRIELLETGTLDTAGVADVHLNRFKQRAADVDAWKPLELGGVGFQGSGKDFAAVVLGAHAGLPSPVAGGELICAVRGQGF